VTLPFRAETFTIARNPEPGSKLQYLLKVPLPDRIMVLKASDTWPRTTKIYCHRVEEWPLEAEILQEVPVRSCRRRGVAIDLVLDRARENRSQIIFTKLRDGREAIFWQSPKTTKKARPGVRIPTRRASQLDEITILIDTRERYPYRFAKKKALTERKALPAGDYGIAHQGEVVAVVERKTVSDLSASLVNGSLAYALAELSTVQRAALVVEDRYADIFNLDHVTPGFVPDLLAAVQVRYPRVPIVFCDTRPLAEEWVFRYLGAALAFVQAEDEAQDEDYE